MRRKVTNINVQYNTTQFSLQVSVLFSLYGRISAAADLALSFMRCFVHGE